MIEGDQEAIEENFRIRAALEGLAAGLAAEKMADRDLADIEALHRKLGQCKPRDRRIHDLNRQLHFRIYECARSPLLISLLRLLWQSLPGGPQVFRPHAESIREHACLIESLLGGSRHVKV